MARRELGSPARTLIDPYVLAALAAAVTALAVSPTWLGAMPALVLFVGLIRSSDGSSVHPFAIAAIAIAVLVAALAFGTNDSGVHPGIVTRRDA